MLKLNNIEVAYLNVIRVLHGVSLKVDDGAIVALLGANGAGKSTTLKAISGLLKTEEGEVTEGGIDWNNARIERTDAEHIGRMGIIQALEGRHVFGHLTAEENLLVGAFNRSDSAAVKRDLEMVYAYFPRLRDLRNNIGGYLSGGEQQMVVIGRAMMARPKLMMLDEPSLGLAPMIIDDLFGILKRINQEEGTSLLIAEQNVKFTLKLSDVGYIIDNGRICYQGTVKELIENEEVRRTCGI